MDQATGRVIGEVRNKKLVLSARPPLSQCSNCPNFISNPIDTAAKAKRNPGKRLKPFFFIIVVAPPLEADVRPASDVTATAAAAEAAVSVGGAPLLLHAPLRVRARTARL